MSDIVTNPNGANQYNLDPRQKMCWDAYVNPKSETFGNAKQSAIKAGYTEEYANQITVSEWFIGKLRRLNLLGKAEKVLDDTLEMPIEVIEYDWARDRNAEDEESDDDSNSHETKTYLVTDPALIRIKLDAAKFVASTQGKDVGYSTRNELTGANGKELNASLSEADKAKMDLLLGLAPVPEVKPIENIEAVTPTVEQQQAA